MADKDKPDVSQSKRDDSIDDKGQFQYREKLFF
jgi:hypothetical protein